MILLKRSKAQSSMELIFIYGWIVLTIAVALVALNWLGVLNIEVISSEGCVFHSGLSCIDSRINNQSVEVLVSNEIGFMISNITLTLNSSICDSFADTSQDTNESIPQNKPVLDNGERSLYIIPCSEFSQRKLDGRLTLGFTNVETGQEHQKVGFIKLNIY